jgi:hypothetical protein
MEDFLYQCLYDVMRCDLQPATKLPIINRYKAQLVRHSASKPSKSFLHLAQKELLDDETPSLYHIIRTTRRRTARHILRITDDEGVIHETQSTIARAFITALITKYEQITVDSDAINEILAEVTSVSPILHTNSLERPITAEEIEAAVKKGGKRKAPGLDGLPLEFYSANWNTIKEDLVHVLNSMFIGQATTQQQKRGIIVNLPKDLNPRAVTDYRQITLLPTDYKLLARIVAQRIKQVTGEQINDTQYCGVEGRTITEALATVRDVIAYAEYRNTPMCVLTIDFSQAFDRISHEYLFRILPRFGISDQFIEHLQALYEGAEASVQINGEQVGNIPIRCCVRQGCPLSTVLYTLFAPPTAQTTIFRARHTDR